MANFVRTIARFLVWVSASREQKMDALVAFDELYADVIEEFGPAYASIWAIWQGVRALPYGILGIALRVGVILLKAS